MSDIRIRRAHAMTPAQARAAADEIAARLADEFGIRFEWEGPVLHFHRSGVEGRLRLERKAVCIEARLGFLLAMLKPKIEQHIHESLDRVFARSAKPSAKAPAKKK